MILLRLFLFFFLFCSFRLSDRLQEAKEGDFIVTEQSKNFSLLLVRKNTPSILLLEEATLPSSLAGSIKDWKEWILSGARGHTSWIQYQLDPTTWTLVECYSYAKKGWLYPEASEHFLANLLTLSLEKTQLSERKKIGPPPQGGEKDQRPFWQPSTDLNGTKKKISCEVWKGRWPTDQSLLSSCEITLYLPPTNISAFPLWIEASNGHVRYAVRTVALGKEMQSPLPSEIPKRPPQFLKPLEKNADVLRIPLRLPPSYKKNDFSLYLLSFSPRETKIGPLPFTTREEKGITFIEISWEHLRPFAQKGKHYKWLLEVKDSPLSLESEELFPSSFLEL